MSLLNLTDEEMDCLASLASALPIAFRDGFVRLIASKLAGYPFQARGPGLVHRLAAEAQRDFINVAIGRDGKYGRLRSGRR
jgi:hypothetical protein